jgi:phosphoadenosine phosphosulfate reductase
MSALERLRFCLRLFPNLYQSTAFGLTGLVTIDMLSSLAASEPSLPRVEAVFLDTLHHFPETYALVDRVRAKYPAVRLHVYRPDGVSTASEFEEQYGSGLYDSAAELYDWIAKVEPQQRAYSELNVAAVLTGRRRSQGGERDKIPILEVDEETGIIKINPLLDWSFHQVKAYIDEHEVPYNELLDRGYKSVGDWHSTSPVAAGEDERAGRWKGQQKTECGIHNKKSRYAQFLLQQEDSLLKTSEQQRELASALELVEREQLEAEKRDREEEKKKGQEQQQRGLLATAC